jgi:hypothetical protein
MPSPIESSAERASSSVGRVLHGALDVSGCVWNRRVDPLVPRRSNHPRKACDWRSASTRATSPKRASAAR